MLLSNLGIEVSQQAVAEAGGATDLIDLHGMRVDQLARATRQLAPQTQFWYKEHSRFWELIALVNKYRYPVGVEWQGLFEDEDSPQESETEDNDFGHYSVVTYADRRNRQLMIVDPYKDYRERERIFGFADFRGRWWDTNEITDPLTGKPRLVEDYHMMFIITPREAGFPLDLGMMVET